VKDYVEKTLVYFEDEYKDAEIQQPIEIPQQKIIDLSEVVNQMEEIPI
jgi:hypothetical protein